MNLFSLGSSVRAPFTTEPLRGSLGFGLGDISQGVMPFPRGLLERYGGRILRPSSLLHGSPTRSWEAVLPHAASSTLNPPPRTTLQLFPYLPPPRTFPATIPRGTVSPRSSSTRPQDQEAATWPQRETLVAFVQVPGRSLVLITPRAH